ncbi:hypothetical protein HUJ04_000397 [Dendroctonus ponderosae]|nr:hypothetical protein HUJ04_000397 [Dendroctonus ponderosae]
MLGVSMVSHKGKKSFMSSILFSLFVECRYQGGALLITCSDQVTVDWIGAVVGKAKPWTGAELVLVEANRLPKSKRAIGFIPKITPPERTLHRIGVQNNLNTSTWKVVRPHYNFSRVTFRALSSGKEPEQAQEAPKRGATKPLKTEGRKVPASPGEADNMFAPRGGQVYIPTPAVTVMEVEAMPSGTVEGQKSGSSGGLVGTTATTAEAQAQQPRAPLWNRGHWSQGRIRGLGNFRRQIVYCQSEESPRTWILIRNTVRAIPLWEHCSRDLTCIKIRLKSKGGDRTLVLASAYLPHDQIGQPPQGDIRNFVEHSTGNEPTFVTTVRREVIDITICSDRTSELIRDWHVSDTPSLSDHRYIRFYIEENLRLQLRDCATEALTVQELELMATTVTSAYESACPLKSKRQMRTSKWWNPGLSTMRKTVRTLFNRAKRNGAFWVKYKTFPDYIWQRHQKGKKGFMEEGTQGYRRYAESYARLYKALSKEPQQKWAP